MKYERRKHAARSTDSFIFNQLIPYIGNKRKLLPLIQRAIAASGIAPGDSFGFLTIAGDGVGPGMWMYHCHVQSHSGIMLGFFQVLPAVRR